MPAIRRIVPPVHQRHSRFAHHGGENRVRPRIVADYNVELFAAEELRQSAPRPKDSQWMADPDLTGNKYGHTRGTQGRSQCVVETEREMRIHDGAQMTIHRQGFQQRFHSAVEIPAMYVKNSQIYFAIARASAGNAFAEIC